jgi:two-component system chemotaxis response regulator CheB
MSAAPHRAPARVVVVEDSIVQRAKLVTVLEADGDITVVGEAASAPEAIRLVAALRPDVITLDLNIPGGGGQHALEQIMSRTPTAVVVLSSMVDDGTSAPAIESLVAGALLAVPKPMRWTASSRPSCAATCGPSATCASSGTHAVLSANDIHRHRPTSRRLPEPAARASSPSRRRPVDPPPSPPSSRVSVRCTSR